MAYCGLPVMKNIDYSCSGMKSRRLVRETQGSDSSKNLSVSCVLRSTLSGTERSFSSSPIYAGQLSSRSAVPADQL